MTTWHERLEPVVLALKAFTQKDWPEIITKTVEMEQKLLLTELREAVEGKRPKKTKDAIIVTYEDSKHYLPAHSDMQVGYISALDEVFALLDEKIKGVSGKTVV